MQAVRLVRCKHAEGQLEVLKRKTTGPEFQNEANMCWTAFCLVSQSKHMGWSFRSSSTLDIDAMP